MMVEVFGAERRACAARELTKLHETQYRGTLAEVAKAVAADPYGDAGEFVLLVGPAPESAAETGEIRRVLDLLSGQVSRRTAIDLASSILNRPRNEVYAQALAEEPPA